MAAANRSPPTATGTGMSATVVSLPQMVDLALRSPEVGAVNFNILHSLLHIMIQQMELQQCAVEFRGADSDRIQTAMAKVSPLGAKLHEYSVIDRSRCDKEIATQATQERIATTVLLAPGRQSRSGQEPKRSELASSSSSSSVSDPKGRRGRGCRRCRLLDDGEALQWSRRRRLPSQVLEVLASSQRLERLSEDLASLQSQVAVIKTSASCHATEVQDSSSNQDSEEMRLAAFARRTETVEARLCKLTSQAEDAFQRLRVLEDAMMDERARRGQRRSHHRRPGPETSSDTPSQAPPGAFETPFQPDSADRVAEMVSIVEALQTQAESQGEQLCELLALRREAAEAMTEAQREAHAAAMRAQGLQEDVDSLTAHLGTLFRERDERHSVVQAMRTRLEALESQAKTDRWSHEAALADKADRSLVSVKVSHTEFAAACTNLHHGLGETRLKLEEAESRLEAKLDRSELPAVAVELAERIDRLVAERNAAAGDQLSSPVTEALAAATKMKLLRNVNCLCCDGRVSMRCEEWLPPMPPHDSFPDRRSARPQLALEADHARRAHQKSISTTLPPPVGCAERLVTRFCGGSHTVQLPGPRVQHVAKLQ